MKTIVIVVFMVTAYINGNMQKKYLVSKLKVLLLAVKSNGNALNSVKLLTQMAAIFYLLLFAANSSRAQDNLVPNPSFEEYTECPITGSMIWTAQPWTGVLGSVDYYNECGSDGYGIPESWGGGGYASTGQAYIGLAAYSELYPNAREYVGVQLTQPLVIGKRYIVEFKLSLIDSTWYGVKKKNMGVYISKGEPIDDIDSLFAAAPYIVRDTNANEFNYYYVKDGWDTFTGLYVAKGDETFITIGNFDNDEHTDTMSVSGGGVFRPAQPYYWASAGYFIDDVSVVLDTTYSVGVEDIEQENKFSVYPNPAKEIITIETGQRNEKGILQILDVMGRVVYKCTMSNEQLTIDVTGFAVGVYTVVLSENGARRKIVIE